MLQFAHVEPNNVIMNLGRRDDTVDTRQAAELWNTSMREVAKYCSQGFVQEAEKVGRKWQIADDAIRPLYFEPSKAEHQFGRKALILQAISLESAIPFDKLSRVPGRIELLFAELVNQGLIMRVQQAIDGGNMFREHMLTPMGETFLSENTTFNKIVKKLPQFNMHLHFQG